MWLECVQFLEKVQTESQSSIRIRENINSETKVKDSELTQKFMDEKEKIRLSDEKKRCEHEEKNLKKKKKGNGGKNFFLKRQK